MLTYLGIFKLVAFPLGKRIWWFSLAFSPCGVQGKLKFMLSFGFTVSLRFYFVYTHWNSACFSIITQVIIEIPKQRNVTILPQFAIVHKSSYHAARSDQCVTQCLFELSLWRKKHFLWRSYRVKTNQNAVSWSVLLSTMGKLHYSFPKQCFLIASACWASLQKFLTGKLTRTSSSFA